MKKFHKKSLMLLIAVTLLLTFSVSGTVAFLAAGSDPVINTFTPAELDTKIVENEDFDSTKTKKSIQIQNNGNIDAYVRVAIVGNWVKDGKIVAPWPDSITAGENWTGKQSDGYYYYTKKLPPDGAMTEDLLGADITQGTPPVEGAHLVITVVHQAIQSQPVDAVKDAWNWTPPAPAQ